MMLPYAGISEPIRVYYDGPNNRSRTGNYIYILGSFSFHRILPRTRCHDLPTRHVPVWNTVCGLICGL